MYLRSRDLILHWFKVPAEPHAPAGDPASLRIFRAGKHYFNLRLVAWGFAQAIAFAGIIFWAVVLLDVESATRIRREQRAAGTTPIPAPSFTEGVKAAAEPLVAPKGKSGKKRVRISSWAELKQFFVDLILLLPPWCLPVLWVLKIAGIVVYAVQIPFTYAVRRLDYEMRWYIVTDRSLRIRTGVWKVQEQTMSFANLQQVEVTQGPVQRLLGLSDVRVQSAGGSDHGPGNKHGHGDSLHTAMFHSVENAPEIRDLILERLRRFRATGLGDPDDHHDHVTPLTSGTTADGLATAMSATGAAEASIVTPDTLAAAQSLLSEARALRQALRER
jgi:membrane protein YdbS with pleckstrin-like domain